MGDDAWFYELNGQPVGPMRLDELRRLFRAGQIGPMVPVWMAGAQGRLTAGQAVGDQPVGTAAVDGGLQYIVPTAQTSATAMIAGYLGIFGFFMCPLGPFALALGIKGLADLKKNPHKNGSLRAWTGIICGGIQTAVCLIWLFMALAK